MRLHSNGLLRIALSIRGRQHQSPGGRHLYTWSRWSWTCGLPASEGFLPVRFEWVSSHAVSFGHMAERSSRNRHGFAIRTRVLPQVRTGMVGLAGLEPAPRPYQRWMTERCASGLSTGRAAP
jgi:hypothetical protein